MQEKLKEIQPQEENVFDADAMMDSLMKEYKSEETDPAMKAIMDKQMEEQKKLTELFWEVGGNTRKFKRALEKKSGKKKWSFGGYKR